MKLLYNIAGLNVLMDTFGRTLENAKAYRAFNSDPVDIIISSSEYKYLNKTPAEIWPCCSEDDREYLATGVFFYRYLLNYDGIMLHSSAVVVDGKAYLFSADPGTGKSTHTDLWLKQFGDRAYILNDDKPALRLENDVWYAYGTPWSGKSDINVNARVPVAGVAFLERAVKNSIVQMDPGDAAIALIMQINRSRHAESIDKIFNLYDRFIQNVPIWNLKCNMDPEAAIVSYEAMSGEKFIPNK